MDISHYESLYKNEKENWWYKVRRIFVRDLLCRLKLKKEDQILDVGCGTGELMIELNHRYSVKGIDFSSTAIEFCKKRGLQNIKTGDITNIPYADNSFDCVLALDILEHIKDDDIAVKELSRILKVGGKAIIFVPAFMIMWGITDELSHHFRRYNMKNISTLFMKNGFTINYKTYFNSILFLPILFVRLINRYILKSKKNENEYTNGLANKILELIFFIEIKLLRFVSLPFGVSICLIVEKNKN
jgi:SAM-dependent methyltransferase